MKPRFVAIIFCILLVYSSISFYIGWNGWLFLSTLFTWENAGWYTIFASIIAYAYIIGRLAYRTPLKPAAEALKLIGSYWFAVLEYAVLILPPANILSLVLKAARAQKPVYIIAVGCIAILLMAIFLVRGSWNAWSPIIRTYHVFFLSSTEAGWKNEKAANCNGIRPSFGHDCRQQAFETLSEQGGAVQAEPCVASRRHFGR